MNKDNKFSTKHKEKVNSEPSEIYTKEGKKIDIPIEGSLGLLALGAKGLIAWREKRDSVKNNNN